MQCRVPVLLADFTRGLYARAPVTGICLLLSATCPAPAQVEPPGQIPLIRFIQSMERGHADISMLEGSQVRIFGEHRGKYEPDIRNLGALKSVKLRGMNVRRLNIYDVVFEHGDTVWQLGTEPPDGGIQQLIYKKIEPGTHENLRELSCVGPGAVSGTMIWPNLIALPEFKCSVGSELGQSFGGDGSHRFGPNADLAVPINVLLHNSRDADQIRIGSKATVSGHFFMVNDVTIRSLYLEVRDAVVDQGPAENDIILPSRVYAGAQPAQPLPKPQPPTPPEPDPQAEAALRHLIQTIAAGKPDYGAMTGAAAEHVERIGTGLQAALHDAGAIQSMTLVAKNADGQPIYAVTFEHGANQFSIRLGNGPAPGQVEDFSYGPHLAEQAGAASAGDMSSQ
jgi:hypothetical protein